ncbi:MAG TPA: Uma2 family endonuclease [Ktedonosporobacter sp.]|nr:Uma2 family endonuclease [Ktedonosporobacter sp.]
MTMTIYPRRVPPQTGERMSVEAYFQLDATFPDTKYEYLDGVVRLMSGGSAAHATIAGNIYVGLRLEFRSGPCAVYNSDMRVQVAEGIYYLPDVSVTCNVEDRRRDAKTVRSPRLVVEVLAPSTEKVDRGEKLQAYQACPTIAEIVLVSQFAPYVEIWRRDEEDEATWRYVHYEAGEEVEFASLDVRLAMQDIYQQVNFDEPLREE